MQRTFLGLTYISDGFLGRYLIELRGSLTTTESNGGLGNKCEATSEHSLLLLYYCLRETKALGIGS